MPSNKILDAVQGLLMLGNPHLNNQTIELTHRGRVRQRAPTIDLSTYPVPPMCRDRSKPNENVWHPNLLYLPTIKYNKLVKKLKAHDYMTERDNLCIKLIRRRLKNAEYTRKAREACSTAFPTSPPTSSSQ